MNELLVLFVISEDPPNGIGALTACTLPLVLMVVLMLDVLVLVENVDDSGRVTAGGDTLLLMLLVLLLNTLLFVLGVVLNLSKNERTSSLLE
jgi:hypothetical protein